MTLPVGAGSEHHDTVSVRVGRQGRCQTRVGFAGSGIHKFHSDHRASTADVTDLRVFGSQCAEPFVEDRADLPVPVR